MRGSGRGGGGGGWLAGDRSLEAVSSQAPKSAANVFPRGRNMAKSCSCWDDASLRPGWSCSSALSLHPPPPLNNTILPPKIKLYLYLYNTPSSPALPSRRSRGLCYRQGMGAHWLQTHIRWGARLHPGAKPVRGEQGLARGVKTRQRGSRTYTQPHTLKRLRLSENGVQGTPALSGWPSLCHTAGRQTLERGAPGAYHAADSRVPEPESPGHGCRG